MKSQVTSSQMSRLGSGSRPYFDFLDSSHSVFSKDSYYSDMSSIHPWLRRPYSRYSGIAYSTLYASTCSARVEELARPKIKRERLIRQGNFKWKKLFLFEKFIYIEFFDNITNYAYSGVKSTALKAECSQRLAKLARPKGTPVGYVNAYDLPRAVPESALRAHLSKRIDELAKPRHNKLTYTQSLWQPKQKS